MVIRTMQNYIDGSWVESQTDRFLDVRNPATKEILGRVPLSLPQEAQLAAQAAQAAFLGWRETTPYQRARYMFRLKEALEARFEDLSEMIVREHGKIIDEARGEVRRGIENIEVAAGTPSMMMGYNAEDVAAGIDEDCILQPLGVFCCVAPFNFPFMVPLWFMPYAIACGNTYIIKPSEICPLSQNMLFEILDEVDFPPGVINLVHGDKGVVDALLEHPDVKGVSFVGSTPVGRAIYAKAAKNGKRAQCQSGAKNCLVVMPDADLHGTVASILTSAFGTAGQRCLANSLIVTVGEVHERLVKPLVESAAKMRVGNGLDQSVQMGPVVSQAALDRIHRAIEQALEQGARLLLDGHDVEVIGDSNGFYIGPTIFDGVKPSMNLAQDEIFGPVLGIIHVDDFEQALDVIHQSPYGNAASLFTSQGKWAREFKYRVQAGNIGINIGIAAPIASFPFGGMKESFFGDLHGQGRDAIQFFTDRKVVISRWF